MINQEYLGTQLLNLIREINNSYNLINDSERESLIYQLLEDIVKQKTLDKDDIKNIIIRKLKEKNDKKENDILLNNYYAKKKIFLNIAKILLVSSIIITTFFLSCSIYLTLASLLLNMITIDSVQQIYNTAHSFSTSDNIDMKIVEEIVSGFVNSKLNLEITSEKSDIIILHSTFVEVPMDPEHSSSSRPCSLLGRTSP